MDRTTLKSGPTMALSSRGLGRDPLKVETRVRISLGLLCFLTTYQVEVNTLTSGALSVHTYAAFEYSESNSLLFQGREESSNLSCGTAVLTK
jgi:hypothetical protein